MTYHKENTQINKLQINANQNDIAPLFGGLVQTQDRKPRGYGEYTKKCDNNYSKIGLRK